VPRYPEIKEAFEQMKKNEITQSDEGHLIEEKVKVVCKKAQTIRIPLVNKFICVIFLQVNAC